MTSREAGQECRSLALLVYLNFAILLPIHLFQNGPWRCGLLLTFFIYLLIQFGSARAIETLAAGLGKAGLLGQFVVFAAIPFMVLKLSLNSPNKVRVWETLVIIGMIAALLWRDTLGPAKHQSGKARLGWVLVALALTVPMLNLLSGVLVPKLSDVATTTADAVQLVLHGRNPYAASLDPYGAIDAHSASYAGYKYLPLMLVFYWPFVASFGAMGALGGDAVAVAVLCAVVWALARSEVGCRDNRLVAVAVLLVTPALAETSLAMGYNDVAGTVLVMAAFWMRGRSALLAGLCVGCGLSFKLMPGLVAVTILFPPDRWKPYFIGLMLGLLPTLAFLAWDPSAFVRNVLLFNLIRSPDSTSWRMFAPSALGSLAGRGAMLVWVLGSIGLAYQSWRGTTMAALDRKGPGARLILFVMATLMLIITGSTAHDDYMIWWAPALIAIFAHDRGTNGTVPPMQYASIG